MDSCSRTERQDPKDHSGSGLTALRSNRKMIACIPDLCLIRKCGAILLPVSVRARLQQANPPEGGYLPVADIGVWNPNYKRGYEVMSIAPIG